MIVCDRCQKFLITHNQNKITLRENTGTNQEVVTSFELCDDCAQEIASRLSDFMYEDIPGGTSDDNSPTNV